MTEQKSLRRRVRNAFKSKEDRLIEKYNVKLDNGAVSKVGRDILVDILFEENKAKVVERLEKIEKDES